MRLPLPCRLLPALGWLLLAIAAAAQAPPPGQGPPPSVTVQRVMARDIAPSSDFIGRVEAIQSVDLRARVEGFLIQVAFREGQDVRQGDLLFEIDPAQFQAALLAAQAQLAQAQANLRQTQSNYGRIAELARNKYQPQSALDQAIAQRDTAAAAVQQAEANVQMAQLNLGYTKITAPIDGRIGKTALTVGNLVNVSSAPLATVVQLDPIRVVFSVGERELLTIKQRTGVSQTDINAMYVPKLQLSNGAMYDQEGTIQFVNNVADPATGTIAVRATFTNPDKLLLPGLLATVTVRPRQPERRILVPAIAVQEDTNGKFVLVVDDSNHVQERRITAPRQIGQDWVIDQGLSEGERVIVDGLQKVRPGGVVTPIDAAPPASPPQAPAAAAPSTAPAAASSAAAPPPAQPSASGAGR